MPFLGPALHDRRLWALLVAIAGVIAVILASSLTTSSRPSSLPLVDRIASCATRASLEELRTCQAEALEVAFERHRVPRALKVVERLTRRPELSLFASNCHHTIHQVAADYARERRLTMADLTDALAPAYGPGCASGFNHGLIIEVGRDLDPTELAASERRICGPLRHRFERHACVHGLGHAFMAVVDGQLPLALAWCRRLGPVAAPDCADAAFHDAALRAAGKPPPPDRLCRNQRGAFAQVCWRRAWTSILEHGARRDRRLHVAGWISRCHEQPQPSRAGCITTLSRHSSPRPEAGIKLCRSLSGIDRIPCLKGVVVSRMSPRDLPRQLRLMRGCRSFHSPTSRVCAVVLGRNLNVLTNGKFERAGCRRLTPFLRHACRRGAQRFDQALITYG